MIATCDKIHRLSELLVTVVGSDLSYSSYSGHSCIMFITHADGSRLR